MKSIIVALFIFLISSDLYSQTEYKIISGQIGKSLNTINELVSNGYEINKYYIQYIKSTDIHDLFLLSKTNNSKNINKSYIQILADNDGDVDGMYLYGELPESIKNRYHLTDNKSFDGLINELSEKGYLLEHFTCSLNSYGIRSAILSKIKNDNTSIRSTNTNDDNSVIEKARYNLNGVPINKKEKGIQIVVYSDYSTKIINVK